jgi:hypothetical protein
MNMRAAIRLANGFRLGFWLGLALLASDASAQVLSNLQALVHRLPVGAGPANGPKELASSDLDGDGRADLATANTDGSVTLFFGTGGGRFSSALQLTSGINSLRDIAIADLNGDGRPDIAVAAPFTQRIVVFTNLTTGSRAFVPAANVAAWEGVRNLATGDFDGDGRADLAAAGPNKGLTQYRWMNDTLKDVTNVLEVNVQTPKGTRFPKPVYSMKAFRLPGATSDHLVLTHADTDRVWLLSSDAGGTLEVKSFITNKANAHALDVGPLLNPRSTTNPPDLVTVLRDAGTLEIHAGTNTAGPSFVQAITQRIDVPGGPRAVEIVDLNGDGWNDLVVVVRNFDSVITYANSNGTFRLATERPVGSSPRALVTGFFDGDEFPDVAVMNRDSSDLSLLMAHPNTVGYRGVNHLYLTDGNVSGLTVRDFNGDGFDDVIQLHRASGDFSVRLANPDGSGTLEAPRFYTVGNVPSAQVLTFANNDGIPDIITANLGTTRIEKGSVTVRLGNSDGTFGVARRFQLDEDVDGRLFALVPADFNGDGNIDLAAGFLDSRVAFLRGSPDGSFTHVRTHSFVNQARGMVAGDFDEDGDFDLACVGVSGEMWVVQNPGLANPATNLMTEPHLTNYLHKYPAPSTNSFGGRRIIALDHNNDTYLDLIIGSGKGAWLYLGQPGIGFETPPTQLAGTAHFMSDFVLADVDLDGRQDLVISCRGKDCLSVFPRAGDDSFGSGFPVDAPASKYIATGDLDGDGKPDLVGTGRVLWTALTGSAPTNTAPLQLTGQRPRLTNAVINEILAINTALPVDDDGDLNNEERLVDWVEFYNGGAQSMSLNGWKVRATGPDEDGIVHTNEFTFPPTAFFSTQGHLHIFFSENKRTLYHTGFRLSGDGGTLVLFNPAGTVVDRVEYPPQRPNISYARFRDGLPAFAFNPFPGPRRANVFNGQLEPDLKFGGVDPSTFQPGMTSRFIADVDDDVGVSTLTMYYQRLDTPNSETQSLQFHDDGEHGDEGVSDGCFAGLLEGGLASGAEVQFFFEITDLSDQVILAPDEPEFGTPDAPGNAYQLALAANVPSLEISELVANNRTGLRDETNATPDWVEVRNVGLTSVSLDDIVLTQQLGDNSRYHFPSGTVLAPGGHFVVYCDNDPARGPLHAPFRLNNDGETLMLTGLTTSQSRTLIDWVSFGRQEPDMAWARLGAGGDWWQTTPTPRSGNVMAPWLVFVEADGADAVFTFAFPTTSNTTYTVEHTPDLQAGHSWSELQNVPGDGIEKVIRQPLGSSGFFRVKQSP